VFSCWPIIPSLRDICWEAVNHYNTSLVTILQGSLTEGKGSVVDLLLLINFLKLIFRFEIYYPLFCKTSDLNEEVNCTERCPAGSIHCIINNNVSSRYKKPMKQRNLDNVNNQTQKI